ncbi:hypothetical protein EDM68_04720 [Candidatus Uhrbacteria bacterium]|nr:MAG: hypothetical protein EDM68_04720 [Candidatus Uhrbacteria bacterium]
MPSAHTHRFSWRRYKPVLAITLLLGIGLATVAPVAAPVAYAVHEGGAPHADAPETPPQVQPASPLCSNAGDTFDQARCLFFQIIAEVLLIIASLLGRILVFMVDILISFASYNDFGNTIVVDRGWVVVRDLVNMFFIVILLVSAFASIIGYDEGSFHYKRVLPKLLLMAVLINFSRTLILLLVDFSQVMMLTFVNAFQQAGPGNLVAALKIDSVLKMAPPTAGAGTDAIGTAQAQVGTVDQTNLILAIMLAIFMLSISLGIVVIMVGYLIFRIVGLWIALILSPIALFATALPGRLQRGMDNFTGKYWSRLSALLVGGPVMAFFLWLTFAVTQASVGEGGGLAPALNFKVNNPAVTFLTTIGNSQDIASFIVGITLMLMGLDAAVSSAQAISETLGSFAKKTASASKALGKLAATAPYLGAYYAGRGAYRAADRRLDITGKAATAAAATVGQIPILRTALRKPLTEAMTKRRREELARAKELQEGLEHMTPAQRAVMAAATPAGLLATKGEKMAYAQQMMERAAPKNAQAIKDELIQTYREQMTSQKKKELQAQDPTLSGAALQAKLGESQREIENRAQQYADRDVAARQSYFLDKAYHAAKRAGDDDQVRAIEEQLKKNPHLAKNKQDVAKELLADKTALNGMSAQAKGDVATLGALMVESKAITVDKDGNVGPIDRAKMDALKDKITDKGLLDNLEMTEKFINGQQAAGKDVSVDELKSMMIGKNEKGKARMFKMPVKDASKGAEAATQVERAISALPLGEKVTGKKYGPSATLADFSQAQLAPVMTESAKQAAAAFEADPRDVDNIQRMIDQVDAEKVFQTQPAWTVYTSFAEADVDRVDADTWDASAVAGAAGHRTKDQIDAGLKKFETLASKVSDMTSQQQAAFAASMADAKIAKIIVNTKKAGYTDTGRDKSFKKFMDTLVKIEADIKRTGRRASTEEQKALKALADIRAELQKPGNRGVANAYRKTVEPEELT